MKSKNYCIDLKMIIYFFYTFQKMSIYMINFIFNLFTNLILTNLNNFYLK